MVPAGGKAKGDVNPYGVAVVPRGGGKLVRGDALVSNSNNAMNQQGTGSSIIETSRSGHARVFAVVPPATSTKAVGPTTALVALGALTILNSRGHVVGTIAGGDVNGPWDVTAVDNGRRVVLFVTNVLNGTVAAKGKKVHRGTVVRIRLRIRKGHAPVVTSNQVIAKGFTEHTDPAALVVGPGLGRHDVLYVADSARNRIAAVPKALTRSSALGGGAMTVAKGGPLNDPLGLTIAPNGDAISMNGGDGKSVETTPGGRTAPTKTLVANGAGDLFGLAIAPSNRGIYFVNDAGSGPAANSLQLLH